MLKKICAAIVALSMLLVGGVAWQRYQVENNSRTIEIAVDADEVWAMIARDGGGREDYFAALGDFRKSGATSIAVYQLNLLRMEEQGMVSVFDARTLGNFTRFWPQGEIMTLIGQVKPATTYVLFDDQPTFQRVRETFARQFQQVRVRALAGTQVSVLEIPSVYWKDYQKAALWFDQEEVTRIAAMGLEILARPAPRPGITAAELREMMQPLIRSGKVKTVVPTGGVLPGMFDAQGEVAKAGNPSYQEFITLLKEQGWTLGLIEQPNQLGHVGYYGDTVALEKTDYQAARVYAIQRAELDKPNWLDQAGIRDRWFRAVIDRNIRVLYMRLFSGTEARPQQVLKINQAIISEFIPQLQNAGYGLGHASVLPAFHLAGKMLLLPMGIAAAGVLLLIHWLNPKPLWGYALLALALAGAAAIGWLSRSPGTVGGRWVQMRQLLGLGAHVVFPTLAGMVLLDRLEKRNPGKTLGRALLQGVLLMVMTSLVSLLGGITLGTVLADNTFMLEINYFRGVKVSFILPMILVAVYYFTHYGLVFEQRPPRRGFDQWRDDIRTLLKQPISFLILGALALATVAIYIYIGRSGHTAGVGVSELELRLRNFLEQTLIARPRNKEFLIGHPAIMVMPLLLQRGYRWLVGPALLAAMSGQISIVNSFAHIRTPIVYSVERGLYGLALGIVVGAIVVLVAAAILSLYEHTIMRQSREQQGNGSPPRACDREKEPS